MVTEIETETAVFVQNQISDISYPTSTSNHAHLYCIQIVLLDNIPINTF